MRVVFILTALMLSACTLRSSQLESLQSVLANETDPLIEAAWTVSWNGDDYTVYAVSLPDETVFGYDKRIRLHFDGWNFTEIAGLIPNGDVVRIENSESRQMYFLNERLLAEHECDPWTRQELLNEAQKFVRNCSGREQYQNEIDINPSGYIIRLKFLIHPEYPPITMLRAAAS